MSVIDEVVRLIQSGWAVYHGEVQGSAYERLRCMTPKKARWFTRDGKMLCLGCSRRCAVTDPEGFQLLLPVAPGGALLVFAELPAVSADELLDKKRFVTVPEVAYILGVSKRMVFKLLERGVLSRHPDPPTRITTESVRREAQRSDLQKSSM